VRPHDWIGEAVLRCTVSPLIFTTPGQWLLYAGSQGDNLVLAAGSQADFFGTPATDQHTYPLYSLRHEIIAVLE
jgi:hypothetical protein